MMVIKWADGEDMSAPPPKIRAAQYVRMSTEHQQFSTDNQVVAIAKFADDNGYEIVRTYADEGKSGLNLGGRAGLQQVLHDVETGRADYQALLVYDVSRLGRFQDTDEAATYELRLRSAGIRVVRRLLVDQSGAPKGELGRGEQKSIATDRIILVPGPPDEVEIVREVYRLFVKVERSEHDIAAELNQRGLVTDLGRPWTRGTVHQLLINEKYIGNNVWAQTSFKLKQRHVRNAPQEWVRSDGAFAAIVDKKLFDKAQAIIAARSERLTGEQMLDRLRVILAGHGTLSGLIIDEAESAPSSSAYRSRFGSLLRAYALVGFAPSHDYRYLETNRKLRQLHPAIVGEVIDGIGAAGGSVTQDATTDLLTINGEFTASIVVVRCFQTAAGSLRWKLRLDTALKPDLTVAIRMDAENVGPRDYYLLPRLDMKDAVLRLAEYNGLSLDAYRFETLKTFYAMAARQPWPAAA